MRTLRALLACLCVAVLAGAGHAHALLQGSNPAPGSTVQTPPAEVTLDFSEPVHPQASSAEVVDAAGMSVSVGSQVSPDGRTLRVRLGRLAKGAYTVRWKVLSRLDGHVTTGLLSFGVGRPAPTAATAADEPPWWRAAPRWLTYLAALALSGTLAVCHLALAVGVPACVLLRPLVAAAAGGLVLASVADTLLRAEWLQTPAQGYWPTVWTLLRTTQEGPSLLLRVLAAVVSPFALRRGRAWLAAAVGAAALGGLTATSHAWAAGPVAVLADWLHLAAASVWVGGLPALALLLARARPRERTPLARAFSRWAAYSLAVVTATGAYGLWLHVPGWEALANTGYGRWLLAKLALVALVVVLGTANRYRLLPRLDSVRAAARAFPLWVRAEAAVAALVLACAAVVATSPPARTVQLVAASRQLVLAALVDPLRLVLTVEPAQPGWNRFALALRDARGSPVRVDRAFLRLRKLDEDAGTSTVALELQPDGTYAAEGTHLGLAGFWELEVVLRARGQPDRVASFPLRTGAFQLRSDPEAFLLLRRAQAATEALRTWRETEQITDGAGNVVVTHYTYQRPDRLAFRVVGGVQGVLVGRERFVRTDRGWEQDTLPQAFAARGPALYMQNPLRAAVGRQEPCPGEPAEPCRVVLWESTDGLASFAAWLSGRTHRVHRLLMWAPAHFMTTVLQDFDAPVQVDRPRR